MGVECGAELSPIQKQETNLLSTQEQKVDNLSLKVCNDDSDSFMIETIEMAYQASASFNDGRIKHYFDQWRELTSDTEILQIVQGLQDNFETIPFQIIYLCKVHLLQ